MRVGLGRLELPTSSLSEPTRRHSSSHSVLPAAGMMLPHTAGSHALPAVLLLFCCLLGIGSWAVMVPGCPRSASRQPPADRRSGAGGAAGCVAARPGPGGAGLKAVGAVATPSPGVRIPRPPRQHQQGVDQRRRRRPVLSAWVPDCPLLTVGSRFVGHARGTMGHAGARRSCRSSRGRPSRARRTLGSGPRLEM
jgi:hypothetical protein